MHSVRLEIGKKVFEAVVKTNLNQPPIIEFPQNYPGATSYKDNNESYLTWILQRLRAGENLHITIGQFANIVKPGDKYPIMDPVRALGEDLKYNDLPKRNLSGLAEKIVSYAEERELSLM